MMKFHAALSTGLATFLIAPAVLGGDELETLEAALRATDRALDVVVGVERRMDENPEEAMSLIKQVTEAPILDARRRDERLATLRGEVNLLRTELDQLEMSALERGAHPMGDLGHRTDTVLPPQPSGGSVGPTNLSPVTTGFDDATRAALEVAKLEAMARLSASTQASVGGTASESDPSAQAATGEDGYSADPVRHARAYYKAGHYSKGFRLLKDAEGAEALFWRARLAERMGDLEQAETDLRQVLTMDAEGPFAARAQQDLDFVKWKREFNQRMGARRGSQR